MKPQDPLSQLHLSQEETPPLEWRQPEKGLWASVILRAVADALVEAPADSFPALEWLFDDTDADQSFLWCCQAIDLPPEMVRNRVIEVLRYPIEDRLNYWPELKVVYRRYRLKDSLS